MSTELTEFHLQLEAPGEETPDRERDASPERVEWRPGVVCPACRADRLDYDGLLNLSCPSCGYTLGGCFT